MSGGRGSPEFLLSRARPLTVYGIREILACGAFVSANRGLPVLLSAWPVSRLAAVVEHPIRYSAPLLLSFLDTTKNVALISCKPRWRNFDDGMRARLQPQATYL